jgi:uncharacterized membrane protein YdjX (TVP38/TMEM64 family)
VSERPHRIRVLALGALGVLLVVLGVLWGPDLYRLLVDREAVQAWVASFGPWGPVVSVLLNTAQVLLAPIPGQTVGVVNGYLYGVAVGTLYSLIGVMLGTAVAMLLGRWFGREVVVRIVGEEKLEPWDRLARRQGAAFFFLVFLFPFLPDDLVCFIVGLSPLPIPQMLVLAALGRLPGLVVSCWVGANATAFPWWAWGLMTVVGAALGYLFWRQQERLEQAMVNLIQRLFRK